MVQIDRAYGRKRQCKVDPISIFQEFFCKT